MAIKIDAFSRWMRMTNKSAILFIRAHQFFNPIKRYESWRKRGREREQFISIRIGSQQPKTTRTNCNFFFWIKKLLKRFIGPKNGQISYAWILLWIFVRIKNNFKLLYNFSRRILVISHFFCLNLSQFWWWLLFCLIQSLFFFLCWSQSKGAKWNWSRMKNEDW